MKMKSLIAATALALSGVGAFANTYFLNPSVQGAPLSFAANVYSSASIPVSFVDDFVFALPTNNGSGYSVMNLDFVVPNPLSTTANPLPPLAVILDSNLLSASLYVYDGVIDSADKLVGTFSGSSKSMALATGQIPAGQYYLKITGITSGMYGAQYNGAISFTAPNPISPVPEPETLSMMLVGLGLMGSIALRRNRKNNT